MFVDKTWKNRQVTKPMNRILKDAVTGQEKEYIVSREEGEILEIGDRFDAATMNGLEKRILDGFEEIADVGYSGDYEDLINKPSLPENRKPAPYEEGTSPLYETPTDILYKPADGSIYTGNIEISKYRDDNEAISTSIVLRDSGSYLFNFDITPVKTTYWVDNPAKTGAKIEFVDGSHIFIKPTYVAGIFTGFKFSNGKVWSMIFETGDFPDFE